jgi:putative nucleotidyltransferase with HDIG domain
MPRPELIVVTDDQGRLSLPKAMARSAVQIIDWRDIGGLSSIREGPVLISVDLHDIAKVKLIKDNLPDRTRTQCRIIAVDRGNHWSRVQANGLGASVVLNRPLNIQELNECLQRYAWQEQPEPGSKEEALRREPGGFSIVSAAVALDRLFRAFTCRGPLDLASVEEASDHIMDAICDVGLGRWLGVVRRYHEGTFQHCLLVTGVLSAFGHRTGMRRTDVLTLTIVGLLHDIGKVQVPIHILDKPGKLTEEEFKLMKRHPTAGYEYLRNQGVVDSETLRAVRHHHEYLDGSGYPDGLPAQKIDDLIRITTVCDVYGALMERRTYKAPTSSETALDILMNMAKDGKVEYDLVRALGKCVAA